MTNTLTKILNNMIINKQENEIVKIGDDTAKKATINQDKLSKLQSLLTKGLYTDPITATIIELTNNGIDSVVQAGKNPIENPVIVKITDNLLSIEDKGLGLNQEEFETVVMNYLTSTKEQDNNSIGCFGIGAKSFLSLERSATFICRKDGIESNYLCYQGNEFLEYDLLHERKTEEENGVKVEIPIKGWYEKRDFTEKAKRKLAYYDTVLLYVDEVLINNQIIRSEDWQYSSNANNSSIHFCLKDVYYEIDWNKLGIQSINMPIALRFGLDSGLKPTPSRESIIMNSETIKLIKEKIEKVANWFVKKYNLEVKEYETIVDAWSEFEKSNKYVKVAEQDFRINSLIQYSTIPVKEFSVKNIPNAKKYFKLGETLINRYNYVGYRQRFGNSFQIKNLFKADIHDILINNKQVILVDEVPSRNLKAFLFHKYQHHSLRLLIPPTEKRRKFKDQSMNLDTYWGILNLNQEKKEDYGKLIKELNLVEDQVTSLFVDERKAEESEEYKTWLERRKEEQRQNRAYNQSNNNYKTLNKQEDEFTLSVCRNSNFYRKFAFDKITEKVNQINKFLTVYFDETDKETAQKYYQIVNKRKIRIVVIGKRERLKIKDKHNFMNKEEFEKSKAFKRLVTAIKYDKLLDEYKELSNHSNELIRKCIPKLGKEVEILNQYVEDNYIDGNSEIEKIILDMAQENNLWDYEFMDSYNIVKNAISEFGFLKYIERPSYYDDVAKKEINSLITKMLYHQKTFRGLHSNIEIKIKEEQLQEVA